MAGAQAAWRRIAHLADAGLFTTFVVGSSGRFTFFEVRSGQDVPISFAR